MKKLIIIASVIAAAACSPRTPVSNRNVDLSMEQSHSLVKAGEAVTFTAHATGVSGRDEKIKWKAEGGGDLSSINGEERYARVEYDKPGTYAVVASLYVDGNLVDQERATVQVEPLS